MSRLLLFKSLVAVHVLTGGSGLVSFWVPVAGRRLPRSFARAT